eukprot:8108924-Pyramimonas_sp.AAC.1
MLRNVKHLVDLEGVSQTTAVEDRNALIRQVRGGSGGCREGGRRGSARPLPWRTVTRSSG